MKDFVVDVPLSAPDASTEVLRVKSLWDVALPEDAVIIADRRLYGYLDAWQDAVLANRLLLVDSGEELKTLQHVERLAGLVLSRRARRPLTLVAVGGGSVGDAVGFLASILWRGVNLWHVPSTLVAMVDSAHGGKTAVNLGQAKNQLGTFYPAQKVILAETLLAALPRAQRRDGLVELVKALWVGNAAALDLLDADGGVEALAAAEYSEVAPRLHELIARAIAVKTAIVARDPLDSLGERIVLNLGHTVGHALELVCGVSHGQAVGWGILAAVELSVERAGLSPADARRIGGHIAPLLGEFATWAPVLEGYRARWEGPEFLEALGRDKKHGAAGLRSVLLSAPGAARVVEDVTAADWSRALQQVVRGWLKSPLRLAYTMPGTVQGGAPGGREVTVEASKSQMNRALVIEHTHRHAVQVIGHSDARDVQQMARAIRALAGYAPSEPLLIDCGEGGTTLRFLMAQAAHRPGVTLLYAAPGLMARPHEPLVDALCAGGARVERVEDVHGVGYRVLGWERFPRRLRVRADVSSQFASALALLAAGADAFELEIIGADEMVSHPYFEMTLQMLREVGVHTTERPADGGGRVIYFSPAAEYTQGLHRIEIQGDASSAAVWAVARFVGVGVEVTNPPVPGLQPDARVGEFLEKMRAADADTCSDENPLRLDVGECPDLVPALSVAALAVPAAVQFVGAAHLRHKESNRIEDLVALFDMAGIRIAPRPDGVFIPAGIQRARDGARVKTFRDHRLAMAALLLSAGDAVIVVEDPWVVVKSYPGLWRDARAVGWGLRAAAPT